MIWKKQSKNLRPDINMVVQNKMPVSEKKFTDAYYEKFK